MYISRICFGKKAKEGRKEIECTILEKKYIFDDFPAILKIDVPHKLAKELTSPGSFVFLRNFVTVPFSQPYCPLWNLISKRKI